MTGSTPKKDPLNDQRPTKERGGGVLFLWGGTPPLFHHENNGTGEILMENLMETFGMGGPSHPQTGREMVPLV